MRRLLVDADAFINLRTLSLLETLLTLGPPPRVLLTRIVRSDELKALDREMQVAELQNRVAVVDHTPARKGLYFKLLKASADPGEAEAIAWRSEDCKDDDVVFVTCDREARKFAKKHLGGSWDVLDVALWLMADGHLSEAEAKGKLVRWEDPAQEVGKPADYVGFDASVAARRKAAAGG